MLLVGRLALGLAACVAMAAGADIDKTTLAWMQTALDRWATACQQYLKIVPQPLPWVIFFDDRHAWHLNPEKSWLPTSKQLSSVVKFAGRKYHLIQVDHR